VKKDRLAQPKTEHGVPRAVSCRALEVSESWFYKRHDRAATPRQTRRARLDADVKRFFDASRGDYGRRGCALTCAPTAGGCPR
jgi:putative transposase